ncbi:MAG: hypothetical protein PHR19_03150 [Bacteroidales bacterium]|jgi:hypothetical protein|nr:hypothetical protein [Bacteroidales bacterium]HHT51984.1 hypothetical protein [Bacteroidales bacterium]
MRKLFSFLAFLLISSFLLLSCKKTCTCKQWNNDVAGANYTVDLESDGSKCSDYTRLDTINDMISGIECRDE